MRKPIILPIKEPWFSMIRKGEKLEEYRECKDYYLSRFGNYAGYGKDTMRGFLIDGIADPGEYDILFRNGYSNDSPAFMAHVHLRYGTGKKKWGAKPNRKYIILDILKVWELETGIPGSKITVEEAAKGIMQCAKELGEMTYPTIAPEPQEPSEEEPEIDLSDLPFYEPDEAEPEPEEPPLRTAEDYSEAAIAKEWLDDFLTIPKMNKNGDVDYSAMEKYDEYHFEKAKMYVQTLYDLAVQY